MDWYSGAVHDPSDSGYIRMQNDSVAYCTVRESFGRHVHDGNCKFLVRPKGK